jgi:hypothetical protein
MAEAPKKNPRDPENFVLCSECQEYVAKRYIREVRDFFQDGGPVYTCPEGHALKDYKPTAAA